MKFKTNLEINYRMFAEMLRRDLKKYLDSRSIAVDFHAFVGKIFKKERRVRLKYARNREILK